MFLKLKDYFSYKLSEKRNSLTLVLTFDEPPNEKSIRIPEFLNEIGISATFFIPPANAGDKYIERTVSLGHEIGGHGWDHGEEEVKKQHRESAPKCYNFLKNFYSDLSSWRFPGLRTSKEAYENVKEAGFEIDSTQGSYYPVQEVKEYRGLKEYPFLRLPPEGQMDIDTEGYGQMKRFLLDEALDWKGVAVLPFHTWHEDNHFEEFKNLIEKLRDKDVSFKRLIDLDS